MKFIREEFSVGVGVCQGGGGGAEEDCMMSQKVCMGG